MATGNSPVGFCLPIPVPARSRFPRLRPREDSRGTFSFHPRPRGEYIPDGDPCSRNEIRKKINNPKLKDGCMNAAAVEGVAEWGS